MEKELIEIVKTKKFVELNSSERASLHEWIQNEEDFESMKFLYLGMEEMLEETYPSENVKKSLDKLFVETHPQPSFFAGLLLFLFPPQKSIWFKPGFQIGTSLAFAFLIFFALSPSQDFQKEEAQPLTAELKKEEINKAIKQDEKKTELSTVIQTSVRNEASMSVAAGYVAAEMSVISDDIQEDFMTRTIESNVVIPTMEGNENLLEYLSATY
ncbi:MAG: hypothetical protein EBS34_07270 [Flavobacteriales bacterium]|nr:hypothetical protein [Flavobacteriales bacterium]